MSLRALTHVWRNSKQKGSGLLLHLALADFSNDDGESYPSIPTLATKARIGQRHVQRLLGKLIRTRELHIDRGAGPHGCHRFKLRMLELEGATNCHPDKMTGGLQVAQGVTSDASRGWSTGRMNRHLKVEPLKKPSTAVELPDWLEPEIWQDFRDHRRTLKSPLSAKAEQLAIRNLTKLRAAGHDPRRVIEQSIERGWKGLFPLDKTNEVDYDRALKGVF